MQLECVRYTYTQARPYIIYRPSIVRGGRLCTYDVFRPRHYVVRLFWRLFWRPGVNNTTIITNSVSWTSSDNTFCACSVGRPICQTLAQWRHVKKLNTPEVILSVFLLCDDFAKQSTDSHPTIITMTMEKLREKLSDFAYLKFARKLASFDNKRICEFRVISEGMGQSK